MKKIISVLLCAVLLLSTAIPALAVFTPDRKGSQIPVVFIAGDAEPIYNDKDEKILEVSERLLLQMFDNDEKDSKDSAKNLMESVANVLQPFLMEGLLHDNWEPYFENLEKELGDLFVAGRLDDNGNAPEGTGTSSARKNEMAYDTTHDKKGSKGYYDMYDYRFWYDWRLDPMEIAVQLHDYVAKVKAQTGADKVALGSACLGTNVALAYLRMFGNDDFAGLGLLASISKGSEFISQSISGKFHLDMDALNRILTDTAAVDKSVSIPAFATATIDLLSKSGAFGALTDVVKKTIYDKVVEGMTSAITLSTVFTFPCYWACVSDEDYDSAMHYVFGDEGSAKRQKYAGLIEKIERYHNEVAKNIDTLLKSASDDGVNIAVMSKYGLQIVPLGESNDVVGDQCVSAAKSSFGATTSTIYDTLSDEYIAARVAEGKGKYISPDKQIDASTCLFPDYTWFCKNSSHPKRNGAEEEILYTVITADHQYTVDDFTYTQFFIYDYETRVTSPMTEENCHTEHWTEDEMKRPSNDPKTNIFNAMVSYFKWCVALVQLIGTSLKEKGAELVGKLKSE